MHGESRRLNSNFVAGSDSRAGSGAQLASTLLVPRARIPLSTYRLQFNRRFTFKDAAAIVPYLDALGITDCYASSYLTAVPGSEHGYNVADPTRLNPDLAILRGIAAIGAWRSFRRKPSPADRDSSADPEFPG